MDDNNVVTKSELKNFQLIAKLEDNVQALTDSKKQVDKENENLIDSVDKLKKENIKASEVNKELVLKHSELEKQHTETIEEANKHFDSLHGEIMDAHDLIVEIRKDIVSDPILLEYLGRKADAVFSKVFGKGQTIITQEFLTNEDFPLILLVELNTEEFGIITSNYKLVRQNETEYKLTKKNNGKIEIKDRSTDSKDKEASEAK